MEFRKLAREGVTGECSMLLKKMKIEDSDEEHDLLDDEDMVVVEDERDFSDRSKSNN